MKKVVFTLLVAAAPHLFAAGDSASSDMCSKAISEAKDTLQTYRSTVKKNLDGGYITQANYDEAMGKFKLIEPLLSNSKCMSSKGRDLEVYRCLAKSYGDVMGCTKS